MTRPLNVLMIDDSDMDTQIVLREVKQGGYDVKHKRVETRQEMKEALQRETWDVILCDYSMPHFGTMDALDTLKENGADIPFLIVSGTIDEEKAVTILKAGAHDFLLKDKLARLIPAIEREIRDAESRCLRRTAEADREKLIANLEKANAELERFMYSAFHDLRAPLVTIKGFLGVLEKDLDNNKQEQIKRDIRRIEAAADKMAALLSDLLELSRLERVSNQREEVDLWQTTQAVLQSLDEQLRSKNVIVTVSHELPKIYGDRELLRQVLEHLIENAAKYTETQENPTIEIGAVNQDGQQIVFVKDNGIGIDPLYHTRIFNLFEKLDPAVDGTGIGLTLIKRIVELHGGRIWVDSKGKNQGSTFFFTVNTGKEQNMPSGQRNP